MTRHLERHVRAFLWQALMRGWMMLALVSLLVWHASLSARADQVEMRNGDRYVGKVLSLNADTLIIQSEVLGRQQFWRSNVALITLGSGTNLARVGAAAAPEARTAPAALTNTNPDSASFLQLGASTNLIRQVQRMFLGDAGPEANDKFNELLGGLLNGKLTVNDVRAQAKAAADQVRVLRSELGEDAGPLLDGYLTILDKFLRDSAQDAGGATNAPSTSVH